MVRFIDSDISHRELSVPFPGAIAHHVGPSERGDHGQAFCDATVTQGKSATEYFKDSGINACAEKDGGLCTFWMGDTLAVYQNVNEPLVSDEFLAPSTDTNRTLFGDFIGTLHISAPERVSKRLAIEGSLGSLKFLDKLESHMRKSAVEYLAQFLQTNECKEISIERFSFLLVTYIDSMLPGVLDLTERPLTSYITSPEYRDVLTSYFEIASHVISKNDTSFLKQVDTLVPFIRNLLRNNFDALKGASKSNLIRQYFSLWNIPFTLESISDLVPEKIKEIGTIIIASYDTTALSLTWAIAYIEASPEFKSRLTKKETARGKCEEFSLLIEQAVLEAIRLGGSNPTSLWRRTITPFELAHQGKSVIVPVGTMLWLDRWQANRDHNVFPFPQSFNAQNISSMRKPGGNLGSLSLSLLARNRYEINSFSMINTERNPRKCPGRLFSVRLQAVLLEELYSRYVVKSKGIDLSLKPYSSMPRPCRSGFMSIEPVT